MDLSKVVFIEDQPKTQKNEAKGDKRKGSGKRDNGKKVKKVPLKGRTVKYNKPQKPNSRTSRATLEVKNKNKKVEPAKGKPKDELPKNWNKVPPMKGEPKTKKRGGKIYHWCHHCNFWSLHKPGKAKRCQAVDPLGHLLKYFGGNSMSQRQPQSEPQQPQSQNVPPLEFMDWDDISL